MANKRLTTPLGSPIISNNTIVTQSDKIPVGNMVESFIIEFNQKYKEFLTSGFVSPKSL